MQATDALPPHAAAAQRLTLLSRSPGSGLALLLLSLAVLLCAACGKDGPPPLPGGATVLVVGDSISAGFGVDAAQAWPGLLAQQTGWRVINGGISGDLSADALERLPDLLERHAPQLVLLEIGGNDMLRGEPDERIRANLEKMVVAVQGRGARVVLMATPRPSLVRAALSALKPAEFYRSVADQYRVMLLQDTLSEVLSRPEFKLDPLHPNAAGHAALAARTADALRRIGLLR